MSFFGKSFVEELAEQHSEQFNKMSEEEVKRIIEVYKRVRVELRDRLDMLPAGTFTTQRVSAALAQVELALQRLNDELRNEMGLTGETASSLGLDHLIEEIERWDKEFIGATVPININAVKAASDAKNFLFNKHEISINAYSSSVRSIFANGISQAAIEEVSMGEVVSRISKTFLGQEWQLHRLVRTEVMGIYSLGKLYGMKDLAEDQVPDLMKTLWHPMDSRTGKDSKILAQDNPIVPVDEPFVEDSTGRELRYMMPPNRPNDRSILIPYRKAWAENS